jgi:mannan endo-1,4-beta-mannosidase
MKERLAGTLSLLSALLPCYAKAADVPGLSDPHATEETRALFMNLKALSGKRLLFGMQQATYRGKSRGTDPAKHYQWWNNTPPFADRSDCKDIVGSHPAVHGFNINYFANAPGNPKHFVGVHMQEAYRRGAVITFFAIPTNPVVMTGNYEIRKGDKRKDGGYQDLRGDPVRAILFRTDGGKARARLLQELDVFAAFMKNFRGDRGELIPIIFRPWHENSFNGCFWWDRKNANPDEFKALFRLTARHLRKTRGMHNLLFSFSPDHHPSTRKAYLECYPGDDVVDVLSFDRYFDDKKCRQWTALGAKNPLLVQCRTVVALAEEKNKIAAIGEFGLKGMPESRITDFFTRHVLEQIKNDPQARKVVYALTWANQGVRGFLPYDRMPAMIPDFRKFHADPYTVFQNDLRGLGNFYSRRLSTMGHGK